MKKVSGAASKVAELPAVPEMEYSSITCTRSSSCDHHRRSVTGRHSRAGPTKSSRLCFAQPRRRRHPGLSGVGVREGDQGISCKSQIHSCTDNLGKQSWYAPTSGCERSRWKRFELIPSRVCLREHGCDDSTTIPHLIIFIKVCVLYYKSIWRTQSIPGFHPQSTWKIFPTIFFEKKRFSEKHICGKKSSLAEKPKSGRINSNSSYNKSYSILNCALPFEPGSSERSRG